MKKMLLILGIECMFAFVAYAQPSDGKAKEGMRKERPGTVPMFRQNRGEDKQQFNMSKEADRHAGREGIMERREAQNAFKQERRDQASKAPAPQGREKRMNEYTGNPAKRDIQRDKMNKWEEFPFNNMVGPSCAGPRTHGFDGKHSPYFKDYRYFTPSDRAHNFEMKEKGYRSQDKGMHRPDPRGPRMIEKKDGLKPFGPGKPRDNINFNRPESEKQGKEGFRGMGGPMGRPEAFDRPGGPWRPIEGFKGMRQRGPMNFVRPEEKEKKEAEQPK